MKYFAKQTNALVQSIEFASASSISASASVSALAIPAVPKKFSLAVSNNMNYQAYNRNIQANKNFSVLTKSELHDDVASVAGVDMKQEFVTTGCLLNQYRRPSFRNLGEFQSLESSLSFKRAF